MRVGTTAAVAATTMLTAGAAAVAAGRYGAGAALGRGSATAAPPGFAPGGLTVHDLDPERGHITLTRSLDSALPGRYGLVAPGCHAAVGEVLGTGPTPDTLRRRLERVDSGELRPGTRVRMTPQVYAGNPGDALGLPYAEVEVPGELGTLPAWFLPGTRDTWVLTVHGLGTTREHPMVAMPLLDRMQTPVLAPCHRGDAGAPRSPDGVGHLGATEWRDLDAAMRYAVRHGANRIVLYGWSTGASMALHAAAHSALRAHISGLVLDSPVLDWRAAVRALVARRVPGPLLPLAARAAEARAALDPARLARLADPSWLTVPALVIQGRDDPIADWSTARQFAAARPELVTLDLFPDATHAASWNADQEGCEETLRRFLTPLM
ncbi:lysophospholipase [Streptomyces sp. P38-E01]|uniref:Lysophospholipase n=1 Tax=Streptomyces tardus TaxID=2780544 RepID=A0A949JHS9_9ACTN|nr:alpha/beta fold hydrolase [Streptomyces tardus]MBU7599712.1 lysophospholipase [Streptomyces tardus]